MRTATIEILNLVSKNNIASSRFWFRTATHNNWIFLKNIL